MRCLPFLHGGDAKDDDRRTGPSAGMSASVRSFSTEESTERGDPRSGSDLNSINVSDMSAESIRRTQYPSFTDRPANLRVFTFPELKAATRNFSRSLMVGEGGFGCVYRGVIKGSDDPTERVEIAVKQLNRKGVQA
uniref:Protein kinase domain-containing protein n=1 Tax=Aegilops tauschii subsp. strangulata TaxID=200361 RepID=A0A453Q3J3_AEGTS